MLFQVSDDLPCIDERNTTGDYVSLNLHLRRDVAGPGNRYFVRWSNFSTQKLDFIRDQ